MRSASISLPSSKRALARSPSGSTSDAAGAERDDVGRERRRPARRAGRRDGRVAARRADSARPALAGSICEITRPVFQLRSVCPSGSQATARTGVLELERAQRLHRVRAEGDAGADLLELRRRLVDVHLEAAPAQRMRGGQAADAAADDGDAGRSRHVPLRPVSLAAAMLCARRAVWAAGRPAVRVGESPAARGTAAPGRIGPSMGRYAFCVGGVVSATRW